MSQAEVANILSLLDAHPLYKFSNDSTKNIFRRHGRAVQFTPGSQILSGSSVPGSIFLIASGELRILDKSNNKLSTVTKQGAGSAVGLLSLIRARPFEEALASTSVIAIQLDDHIVLDVLSTDLDLITFISSTPSYPEAYDISRTLLDNCAKPKHSTKYCAELLFKEARPCVAQSEESLSILIDDACKSGEVLMLSSATNNGLPIGSRVSRASLFCEAINPLKIVRVLALPEDIYKDCFGTSSSTTNDLDLEKDAASSGISSESLPYGQPPEESWIVNGKTTLSTPKLIRGHTRKEQILACFLMLGKLMGFPVRRDSIEQLIDDCEERKLSLDLYFCAHQASICGLHVVTSDVPVTSLTRVLTPSLIEWNDSISIVYRTDQDGIYMASPREGLIYIEASEIEAFDQELRSIRVLSLEKNNKTPLQKFNITWLWPAVTRYKSVLLQVLVASFVVQLFSLANPMLIQVIIDKVISQRSLDTLQLLGISLVVVTLFEAVIGGLRTYLFSDATNRIDLRLGSQVIDHLLRLPLTYFDNRPVGELSTRISELEKIRNFLTGQALTTVLDAAFSVIYICVMFAYSWLLTLMALAVLPIQVVLTLIGAPLYRKLTRSAAEENAKTQSQLVEVLTNIQTIKAQNVETISRWKWHEYYANYISKSFDKTVTVSALSETSQALQKLSQLLVLWVGASMVLNGELTLGQLIAFRIIAGYVTQPLLRLSTIWQNIQELRVSFERLADVVDAVAESSDLDRNNISLPPITGEIEFEDVCFRFDGAPRDVLKNINLKIPAGSFVGIVGQSGSGKSTLTKLIARLYSTASGSIKIDGYDISKVELNSLRRQIGIVPQEPLLFSGSVAENISLTNPDAPNEQITQAATTACAHDFIMLQPNGYASKVGERGSTLSGGQRQRIAIARTLLSNPKLLIMDEATSALDYATESRLCSNLISSLRGCTTLFITHRLSTVKKADVIVMMHDGAVAEVGTHNDLMRLRGRYFALYTQQENS